MSDAIQVSNVDKLDPEDRSVFKFLSRAANALVQASDLGREVAKLTSEVSDLSEAYSNVDSIRQHHEDHISRVTNDWHEASSLAKQRQEIITERCSEIERLKAELAKTKDCLVLTTQQYDAVRADLSQTEHELAITRTERDDGNAKLKKFREILGLPDPIPVEAEPIKTPEAQQVIDPVPPSEQQTPEPDKQVEPIEAFGGAPTPPYLTGIAQSWPQANPEGGPDALEGAPLGKYEHSF